MNIKNMRIAMFVLAFVFGIQTVPAHAEQGVSGIIKAYIQKHASMNSNLTKSIAIFGATTAIALGTLWLANTLNKPHAVGPQQATGVPQQSLFSRACQWLKNHIPTFLDFHADPLYHIVQELRQQVREYQPATNAQCATVPYFNDPQNMIGEAVAFDNPLDHAHVIVQQAQVLNQFSHAEINGGASCGYQALKNGCGLAGLIKGQNGGKLLTDLDVAADLFGADPQGLFRQKADTFRKKAALRTLLTDQLIPLAPRNPAPNEDTKNMRIAYTRIIEGFLDQQINIIEQGRRVDINERILTNYVQHAPITNRFAANAQFIRNQRNIVRYVNMQNIHLSHNNLDNAIIDYNNSLGDGEPQRPENGELLESNEIEQIIQTELLRRGSVLNVTIGNTPIYVIESTVRPQADNPKAQPINQLEIHEQMVQIRNSIHTHTALPHRLYVFIIGSADQFTRAAGHWITMTLEIANGMRRYTITDSAANHVKMFDGPAANIIRFIEGEQAGNLLRPHRTPRLQAAAQLRNNLFACEKDGKKANLLALQRAMQDYSKFKGNFSDFKNPEGIRSRVDNQLARLAELESIEES